jgi:hypothetical protein
MKVSFLIIMLMSCINSLHFLIKEGKEKCIYDEIPKN